MKITIVGPGAMGCLFASLLSKSKTNEVWLLDKNPARAKYLNSRGIRVTGLSKINIPPVRIKVTTCAKQIGVTDIIILFVKSYDTREAIIRAIPCVNENTLILTLQNGLNNILTIKKNLIAQSLANFYAGTTSHGATLIRDGIINHAGKGETIVGRVGAARPSQCKKIKRIFTGSGIDTRITGNVEGIIWSKLILNSAINPLATVSGCRNGSLVKIDSLKELLFSVTQESTRVVYKKNIKLPYKDVKTKVAGVCDMTRDNINSMLQDILKNKQTEIDYINGAIAREGRKSGVKTPLNDMLWQMVKKLENTITLVNRKGN
jgi:2-dehydropantoate 2-reductase